MLGNLLIGRYRVYKQLGSGGFSETYLVRDKYLPQNPLCVVKTLRLPDGSSLSLEDAKQLFHREAQLLHELGKHDGLPYLLAFTTENDELCIVEEYISGENLEVYPQAGQEMEEAEVASLLQDVLKLLDIIHSKNIIHQDIKPSNLIRQPDGRIALIDFGAAIHPDEALSSEISFGTPGYMPAEQMEGRPCFASDFYSLGVTAIQLLTGIHPEEFRRDVTTGEIEFQATLHDLNVSPKLIAVLEKMVRMKASERYESARQAAKDVKAIYERVNYRFSSADPLTFSFKPSRPQPSFKLNIKPPGKRFYLALGAIAIAWGAYTFRDPIIQSASALSTLKDRIVSLRPQRVAITLQNDIQVVGGDITRMAIAPNQVLVTASNSPEIRLWSLRQARQFKTLSGHSRPLTAMALSQDGNRLVTAADDREVRVWEIPSGNLLKLFVDNPMPINAVAISQDNRALATTSEDHNLLVWEIESGRLMQSIKEGGSQSATSISYIPGNLLVCGTEDNSLKLWAARKGELTNVLSGHTAPVQFVQANPYNKLLYSFGDDHTMVWNVEQKQLVAVLPPESARVTSVLFRPNHFLTVDKDGVVRLWDSRTSKLVETVMQVQGQAILSPDAQYLVNYTPDRHLKIWKLNFTEGI